MNNLVSVGILRLNSTFSIVYRNGVVHFDFYTRIFTKTDNYMLFFIDFNFLGEITWWMSC